MLEYFSLVRRSQGALLVASLFGLSLLLLFMTKLEVAPLGGPGGLGVLMPYARKLQNRENEINDSLLYKVHNLQKIIDILLEKQRALVDDILRDYKWHPALNVSSASELQLEKGGSPVRNLVVTSWRSGSTFLGDVMQSHPASFYHYEPLLPYGIVQVRGGHEAQRALKDLDKLLRCDYTNMEHYFSFGRENIFLLTHNEPYWNVCSRLPELCWDPSFIGAFCRIFPFQNIKTVRLRLNLTERFLKDKSLRLQVLLLVRDPRGTLQSRHHRDWCPNQPDCDDPARLCSDLVHDYNVAKKFAKRFSMSFRVLRYEDLSMDIYNMTKSLFDFFHLSYHPLVREFLESHTTETKGGVSSTFRDSKTAPVHWRGDLPWEEVKNIQEACGEALRLWGYREAASEEELRQFDPIMPFKLP